MAVPFTLTAAPNATSVIDAVETGRADVGFLAIEAARAEQVDFSDPLFLMHNAYLVPRRLGRSRRRMMWTGPGSGSAP